MREVLEVAGSKDFVARARALGFSDEAIAALPRRIRQYGGQIGEKAFGGWADADKFLVGRIPLGLSSRTQRIMHELGHVLDDVAHPGLFQRAAKPGFGWKGFYGAERVAYTMQYGRNPIPLTALNATAQAYPTATKVVFVGGVAYAAYSVYEATE